MITTKHYILLFFFFLSVFILTSGGRIAGSDETAFFLETKSIVEDFSLAIPDSIINNGAYGADGKYYLGAGLGYSIISSPFYIIGKIVVLVIPVPEGYERLVLKFFFSLTNQFISAFIGVIFLQLCVMFGFRVKTSFALTLILLFTTNLFVYAKSSMREPLIIFCLILIVMLLLQYRKTPGLKHLHVTGLLLILVTHTKISFVILIPVVVIYVLTVLLIKNQPPLNQSGLAKSLFQNKIILSHLSVIVLWVVIDIMLVFVYNYSMYGNIFSSGYSQRNQSFTNPLFAGLYGLLFSSGKSVFLYAPVTILIIVSLKSFYCRWKIETWLMGSFILIVLILHAKFFAWAGDGSWGPRYLLPVIPFLILMSGFTIESILTQAGRLKKFLFYALCVSGMIIQIGGSAVYFGSYLRYIGEFPFEKEFSDPEFLYKSHYIPNYSPVTGHWELLAKSVEKHLNGEMKNFTITSSSQRLPLTAEDQKRIVYIIDFWFMYAYYAGINGYVIIIMLILSALVTILLGIKTFSVINKTEPHAVNPNSGHCSSL